MNNPVLGPLGLSDLARATSELASHSKPQVRFIIDHVRDHPGHFRWRLGAGLGTVSPIASQADDAADDAQVSDMICGTADGTATGASSHPEQYDPEQALCSAANGVGVLILTSHELQESAQWGPQHGAVSVSSTTNEEYGQSFTGYARPNPSLLYEGGSILEGIIVLEDEPQHPQYRHALMLRRIAPTVADEAKSNELSDAEHYPILSFHSPAQAPPHTTDKDDVSRRSDEWPRSNSISFRFALALRPSDAERRAKMVEKIAKFCSERGFGFWVTDTRSGHRSGNWFGIVQHDRQKARESSAFEEFQNARHGIQAVMPVTFVGPARVGSSSAILRYLNSYPSLGLAACSITVLNDLAFVHLQLVVNQPSKKVIEARNKRLAEITSPDSTSGMTRTPERFLEEAMPLLLGRGPAAMHSVRTDERSKLVEKCGDFQVIAGPILPASHSSAKRVPVWVSWQIRGREARLRSALNELWVVLAQLGINTDENKLLNIEYMICRERRESTLRAKAKFSIEEAAIPAWAQVQGREARAALFCDEVEQRWRARVLASDLSAEVSVGDREYRVGVWSDWV